VIGNIKELQSREDLLECVSLLRAAFAAVAKEYGLTEESAPTNAAFTTFDNLTRHVQSGMRLFGMYVGACLVGCVALKKAKRDDGAYYIERLAVAPEHRHRGCGGDLLSFAIERIRESGGSRASIGLMDDNELLKSWYISKGFVEHDCRRIGHLPFKVCFMSRHLESGGSGP
jgi:diamine N-acetyltransferase